MIGDLVHSRCSSPLELRSIRGPGGMASLFYHCTGCCTIVSSREVRRMDRQLPLFALNLDLFPEVSA